MNHAAQSAIIKKLSRQESRAQQAINMELSKQESRSLAGNNHGAEQTVMKWLSRL